MYGVLMCGSNAMSGKRGVAWILIHASREDDARRLQECEPPGLSRRDSGYPELALGESQDVPLCVS
jgi:hypothetical protein